MVGVVRTWPGRSKGDGGCGIKRGRVWDGKVIRGKEEDSWAGTALDNKRSKTYINRAYYSVYLASMQGLEHHRHTMCTPSGHGDLQRRRIRIFQSINIFISFLNLIIYSFN